MSHARWPQLPGPHATQLRTQEIRHHMHTVPSEVALRYLLPHCTRSLLGLSILKWQDKQPNGHPQQFFLFTICIAFYLKCFVECPYRKFPPWCIAWLKLAAQCSLWHICILEKTCLLQLISHRLTATAKWNMISTDGARVENVPHDTWFC